jgi:hypothetical protein
MQPIVRRKCMRFGKKLQSLVSGGALVALGVVISAIAGFGGTASAAPPTPTDQASQKQLVQVREATAKYQDIQHAKADGYVEITDCMDHPEYGAMGFHYARLDLMPGKPIMLEPDILVYSPQEDNFRLVAVEYFQVGGDRPVMFGQGFDDGPYVDTYALHAWVWHPNPSGMFAPFNPSLRCP